MYSLNKGGFSLRSILNGLLIAFLALLPYAQNGWAHKTSLPGTWGGNSPSVLLGTISGRVTNSQSSGLANIPIKLEGPDASMDGCTDGTGNYMIDKVALGVAWRVKAMPIDESNRCGGSNGYAQMYWNKQPSYEKADTITLTSQTPSATGIDFSLSLGGGISGHVFKANGITPVANVLLFFSSATSGPPDIFKSDFTGSDGSFTFWGFPLGSVYVKTCANCNGQNPTLVDEWYAPGGSVVDNSQAGAVTITAGQLQTGIDFQLDTGGSISGQVKDLRGNPLAKMPVDLNGPNTGMNTCTDDSGNYTFPGVALNTDWKVRAMHIAETNQCGGSTAFAMQFWNQKLSYSEADIITLSEQNPTKTDANFSLTPGGGMSGHVYKSDGVTPVANVLLLFSRTTQGKIDFEKWGNTGSDGSFTVWGFPVGAEYVLTCVKCGGDNPNLIDEWYAPGGSVVDSNLAGPVTITGGQLQTGINFQLDTGGSISGQVKDGQGNPLANIPVNLYGPVNGMNTCSDDSGNYAFQGVAVGVAWKVNAMPIGGSSLCSGGSNAFASKYWNQKQNWDNADLITLTEQNPTKTGVDFSLPPGGGISGHVYNSDGIKPVVNVILQFSTTAPNWTDVGKSWASTGSDGSFTIWGLPVGPVYIRTCVCSGNNPDQFDEWYAPGASVRDGSQAAPVTITADQLQVGIDFQLDPIRKAYLPLIKH